jgi:methylenetetrahydrofolate--tRNA-(uracil-5-)-methyltransferase
MPAQIPYAVVKSGCDFHTRRDEIADIIVVGGGLAGCEAAWQAAEQGLKVDLYEMRPFKTTGAHVSDQLAELVCSNSLGSDQIDRASGLLKEELRRMNSLLLRCAKASALPAGGALAVDREAFSNGVTREIEAHARIRVIRKEITAIPDGPAVIASGPLTSAELACSIQTFTGIDHLFFYDAIAPVVSADSIDMEIAFRASRFGQGEQAEGDYINCPLDEAQYQTLVTDLKGAERIRLREFESDIKQGVRAGLDHYFEGCLPVEVIAERGDKALAFGPMRPIGLRNPHTGRWAHAILQLRQDNLAGSLYNLVGFQTNLTFPEQKRIFGKIPGLENAEFIRYGQMHRNTFIAAPQLLFPTLQTCLRPDLFFAGQIIGVEGYMGNIASGLLAGLNVSRFLKGQPLLELPVTTMLGALSHYISSADLKDFQPMKANYGILPVIEPRPQGRKERNLQCFHRAMQDLEAYARLVKLSLQDAHEL